MGDCKYCGKSAGFLRKQHKECADRHDRAVESIKKICVDAALHGTNLDEVKDRIREAWGTAGVSVSDSGLEENLADGWTHALAASIEDRILSTEEKRGLDRYRRRFGLSPDRLDSGGHFKVFRMMVLLNSMTEGGIIPRLDRKSTRAEFGRLPFNMVKSEELIWVFTDVGYIEQVTSREFRGSSLGTSVRVAKGIYVRPSAFRGRSVESKSMERTDSGMLGITTKHIYFTGSEKSFRVRLEKIVSFEPYQDGLGIMRDTARAKPEMFSMGEIDSWFSINLIETLLDMDDTPLPKDDSPTLDDLVDEDVDDAGPAMFGAGASMSL